MKIGVLSRHLGMSCYLAGILPDYDLKFYGVNHLADSSCGADQIKGEEDLYIVMLPSGDINYVLKYDKPIISYPCLDDWLEPKIGKVFKKAAKRGKFRFILNERCWAESWHRMFPDYPIRFIPYAFKGLPKWTGEEEKIIVAIRDPHRLSSYTSTPLDLLLKEIPYELHTRTDQKELFERMSKCRAMFYFSNSRWTLVFCEAMTIGIPIVTINVHPTGDYANIACTVGKLEFYLKKMLNDYQLAKTYSWRNLKLARQIMNYDQARKLWQKNIKEALNE